MFDRLFGRRRGVESGGSALPVVRNITIGRSLRLDPLAWRRLGADAHFRLDSDTLHITAQGLIDMGTDGFVHRFYTDDHVMFQVVSADREGQMSEDHTVFIPWSSVYPATPAAQRIWLDRLKGRTFTDEGLPNYQRFWFGDADETQDPVSFWETIHDDRAASEGRRIYQTCMLFARALPGDARELLLAIEQEPEGGDLTHEVMIGVPLDLAEFSA
ncbi:MAG: DUF2491 family protein [Phenylobacterium sp.]|uniref:DUF2491 family protein n=1 Tax=Phenylobacterium sp. TaxID=1871053 RepID=UPI002733C09E|nr:DUF2491 family protein [Phenylobacterium sp.]MDP3174528.1 DUF2491 family protein [Phenylobacterium sp.]